MATFTSWPLNKFRAYLTRFSPVNKNNVIAHRTTVYIYCMSVLITRKDRYSRIPTSCWLIITSILCFLQSSIFQSELCRRPVFSFAWHILLSFTPVMLLQLVAKCTHILIFTYFFNCCDSSIIKNVLSFLMERPSMIFTSSNLANVQFLFFMVRQIIDVTKAEAAPGLNFHAFLKAAKRRNVTKVGVKITFLTDWRVFWCCQTLEMLQFCS